MEKPPTGWTTKAIVKSVTDADTVKVSVTKIFTIRLLNNWAEELDSKNPDKKMAAIKAKARAMELLPSGKEVTVFIPTKSNDIKDILTLSRELGYIWIDDDRDIATILYDEGLVKGDREHEEEKSGKKTKKQNRTT